jgi:hypothetical protein
MHGYIVQDSSENSLAVARVKSVGKWHRFVVSIMPMHLGTDKKKLMAFGNAGNTGFIATTGGRLVGPSVGNRAVEDEGFDMENFIPTPVFGDSVERMAK